MDKSIDAFAKVAVARASGSKVRGLQELLGTAVEQARIFLRLLRTERGRLIVPVICISLPLLGGLFLFRSILGKLLREDAQNTSSAWVFTLIDKNPDVLNSLSGGTLSKRTAQFLEQSSQVGDIYRIRVWNGEGRLVFHSERMTSHDQVIPDSGVEQSLTSGSIVNEAQRGTAPQNASYYVRSFIPVRRDGTVVGVFEVYLDQSADEVLYKRCLFLTEILVGGLIIFASGIPVYCVYRQMLKVNEARAETLFLSEHDALTGLPNRRLLNDLVMSALAKNRHGKKEVALLMIDMDRFKDINDSFGHSAGDKVLKTAAKRIQSAILEGDSVARFGGDEFVILQVGMYQPNGASSLAERLIAMLSEPYDIGGSQVICGASIGVAISPPDGDDLDALIACADAALHKAKAEGRSAARFFEPGMDAKIRERRQTAEDIRRALAEDAFQLAYQPLHSFHEGKIIGFEALLRWPEGWQPKSPADFIPIAEECGLMNRIGAWALETACRTAASWKSPLKICVNLSPVQFRDGNIACIVKKALSTSGLDPVRLELEVTESLWIQDTDSVLAQLARLRRMGVSIALDDFGTGYSSLAYLWKFPFDTLKIDQSFVKGMETDPKASEIVKTIAGLGKALDLTITAEGVEKPAQARILREAGCDQAQGFLFGRPMPVAEAFALANASATPAMTDPEGMLVAS